MPLLLIFYVIQALASKVMYQMVIMLKGSTFYTIAEGKEKLETKCVHMQLASSSLIPSTENCGYHTIVDGVFMSYIP